MLQVKPLDRVLGREPFQPLVRQRVLDLLGAANAYRVAVISAPAGFGKSVTVGHYAERKGRELVHFRIRPEHSTFGQFLSGLIESLTPSIPGASRAFAAASTEITGPTTPVAYAAAWLINLIKSYRGDFLIDDLHCVNDPRISKLLCQLVERSHPSSGWIIATRHAFDLPLASWAAYGLMGNPITDTDLCLTEPEATSLAQQHRLDLEPTEISALLAMTHAWPAAFAFALLSSERTGSRSDVAAETRAMTYQYLAEQVFDQLSPALRSLLLNTALLPSLDPVTLEAAGHTDANMVVDTIRRHTCFAVLGSDGVFRYHDLFQDFLRHELELLGSANFSRQCVISGLIARTTGHKVHALDLFTRARSVDHVVDVIREDGFDLVDEGKDAAVTRALEIVPSERRSRDPAIMAVAAAIDNRLLRSDKAEALYRCALSLAEEPQLRTTIALRLAGLLVGDMGQRFSEALTILETVGNDELETHRLQANYYSRKAVVLQAFCRIGEADRLMQRALSASYAANDEVTNLRTMQVAIAVATNSSRHSEGLAMSRRLFEQATELHLPNFASAALGSGIFSAYGLGDFAECQRLLQGWRGMAPVLMPSHSLLCNVIDYSLAAERADETRMLELEDALSERKSSYPAGYQGLAYARGFALAWDGDFRGAYELVANLFTEVGLPEDRAVAASHRLFYASAAGLRDAGEAAAAEAQTLLAPFRTDAAMPFGILRANVLAAIGQLLLGHNGTSNNLLRSLEKRRNSLPRTIALMTQCARELYMDTETGSSRLGSSDALKELGISPIAAYARMFRIIGTASSSKQGTFATLTKTELQVLQLLSEGSTSRQAAAAMKRSPLTIDAHVKALTRKLGCSGRRQAIALARRHGIL